MIVLLTFCFIALGLYVLDLRRQIEEIGESVQRLHRDFISEVYAKYGEKFNGEK